MLSIVICIALPIPVPRISTKQPYRCVGLVPALVLDLSQDPRTCIHSGQDGRPCAQYLICLQWGCLSNVLVELGRSWTLLLNVLAECNPKRKAEFYTVHITEELVPRDCLVLRHHPSALRNINVKRLLFFLTDNCTSFSYSYIKIQGYRKRWTGFETAIT